MKPLRYLTGKALAKALALQAELEAAGISIDTVPPLLKKLFGMLLVAAITGAGAALIPFYPASFAVLLVLATAMLAVRTPLYAVLASTFTLALALGFQAGATLGIEMGVFLFFWMLMLTLFAGLSASTSFGNLIGVGAGYLAALLMLTPAYFASVPLLIVLASAYRKAGKASTLVTYVGAYLPLLLLLAGQTGAPAQPPIYSQVVPLFAPAPERFDLQHLLGGLEAAPAGGQAYAAILGAVAMYFFRTFSAPVFIILTSSAISSTYLLEEVLKALAARGYDFTRLRNLIHIPANLLGASVFAIPLTVLAPTFNYSTQLTEAIPFASQYGFAFLGGALASYVTLRLETHRYLLVLRVKVKTEAEKLHRLVEAGLTSVKTIDEAVTHLPVEDLKAELGRLGQEIELALTTYQALGIPDLEPKLQSLTQIPQAVRALGEELWHRLTGHFLRVAGTYQDYHAQLQSIGLKIPTRIPTVREEDLQRLSNDEIAHQYVDYEAEATRMVQQVVSIAQKAYDIAQKEVDPHLEMSAVEIASNFLKQQEFQKALATAVEALQLLHQRFSSLASENVQRVAALSQEQVHTFNTYLRPIIEDVGEAHFAEELRILARVAHLSTTLQVAGSVLDLTLLPEAKEELCTATIQVLTALDTKLVALEQLIDERTPQNFQWGKDHQIHDVIAKATTLLQEEMVQPGFGFLDAAHRGTRLLVNVAQTYDPYLTMRELIWNYPNVESIITVKLRAKGSLGPQELHVKYADRYFKLYSIKHPEVVFDAETRTLIARAPIPPTRPVSR